MFEKCMMLWFMIQTQFPAHRVQNYRLKAHTDNMWRQSGLYCVMYHVRPSCCTFPNGSTQNDSGASCIPRPVAFIRLSLHVHTEKKAFAAACSAVKHICQFVFLKASLRDLSVRIFNLFNIHADRQRVHRHCNKIPPNGIY